MTLNINHKYTITYLLDYYSNNLLVIIYPEFLYQAGSFEKNIFLLKLKLINTVLLIYIVYGVKFLSINIINQTATPTVF